MPQGTASTHNAFRSRQRLNRSLLKEQRFEQTVRKQRGTSSKDASFVTLGHKCGQRCATVGYFSVFDSVGDVHAYVSWNLFSSAVRSPCHNITAACGGRDRQQSTESTSLQPVSSISAVASVAPLPRTPRRTLRQRKQVLSEPCNSNSARFAYQDRGSHRVSDRTTASAGL